MANIFSHQIKTESLTKIQVKTNATATLENTLHEK